jgi:predicted DNA-binding transcriptional regulator AlpA
MTKTTGCGSAPPPAPDVYLTEREFSERYHVSRRTAQRWRATGDGPAFVRLGLRRVAYRLSDCEAWAAARTFAHRAAELARAAA